MGTEMMEWLAVSCGGSNAYGWSNRGWVHYGGYYPHVFVGYYATTLENPAPGKVIPQAQNSPAASFLWQDIQNIAVDGRQELFTAAYKAWRDNFPGFTVVTTDGRAITLTGYDFWKNKERSYTTLGDFIIRLVTHPRVAELHDATTSKQFVGAKTLRVYSEEDLWLVLEHPELDLMEMENITSSVQRLNALKAEIATLDIQKKQLEAHMAELARQAQIASGESAGATAELTQAEILLQQTIAQQTAKVQEASALERSIQAASKTSWLPWALVGGGVILVIVMLQKRGRK